MLRRIVVEVSASLLVVAAITAPLWVRAADSKGSLIDTQTTASSLNASVVGTKTHNNASPGATNVGTLPGLANAANPTTVEGDQVALSTDLTGALRTADRQRVTYVAGLLLKTATAAGTGVFFSICGSASKTVRIQKFAVAGTVATTAVYGDVILRKTSTATSSGTATALVRVPLDTNSAAATVATPNFYTVLATAGTVIGTIGSKMVFLPVTAAPALTQTLEFSWYDRVESEAPVLRGTAECMIASFGTTTTNAPTLTTEVTWTEE